MRDTNIEKKRSFDDVEALHRGIAILTPPNGLREKLEEAHNGNRPLIVKLGFDPTAPDLHLGHAVVLRKLRQFQDAGHRLVIVIGDFTARIGDPTGRNRARPPLSEQVVKQNAKTYLDQLSKVLDTSESRLEVRFNSEWLDAMNFLDVIKLLSQATVAQLLQREDFNSRYKGSVPIGMHELLYPLMQGHDSVVLAADVEMGGTDQLFNCLIGRALQESSGKSGQVVVSMPLLVGLDGKEKMSKSQNNTIGLTEEPNQMYGKVMSMPDHLLPNYLDLVTDFPLAEIVDAKTGLTNGTLHPMQVKKDIAENVVKQYHGATAAMEAAAFFFYQFQNKDDADKSYKPVSVDEVFGPADSLNLVELCSKLQPDISKAQIRRLIASNAVSVNDEKVIDPRQIMQRPTDKVVRLRIGKRGFFSLAAD
jgi:tyrosyl-tRNA synthetase